MIGGTLQCLNIWSTALVHSCVKTAVNCAADWASGTLPPHIWGFIAVAWAWVGIKLLCKVLDLWSSASICRRSLTLFWFCSRQASSNSSSIGSVGHPSPSILRRRDTHCWMDSWPSTPWAQKAGCCLRHNGSMPPSLAGSIPWHRWQRRPSLCASIQLGYWPCEYGVCAEVAPCPPMSSPHVSHRTSETLHRVLNSHENQDGYLILLM